MKRFPRFNSGGRKFARHIRGTMNKLEQEYADYLEVQKRAQQILAWGFEEITFRLANGLRWTPDFWVEFPDGTMEMIDTKGGLLNDKAIPIMKMAAAKFPQFTFVMLQKKNKKTGWVRRVFGEGEDEDGESGEPSLFGDPPADQHHSGTFETGMDST